MLEVAAAGVSMVYIVYFFLVFDGEEFSYGLRYGFL